MSDVFQSDSHGPDGRFLKGNPGGPGRPRKIVKMAADALDVRLSEAADDLYDVAVRLAREGNERMLKMLLDRLWPAGRSRGLEIDAPEINKPRDLLTAISRVTNATFAGEATAGEGAAVAKVLRAHRDIIEDVDFDERLTALEKRQGPKK